jgi:hypothetical protein
MSATFLVFAVLGVGAVAFLVRFLIALGKEIRNRRGSRVSRFGPRVYEVPDRPADPSNGLRGKGNGNRRSGGRMRVNDQVNVDRIVLTSQSRWSDWGGWGE